MYPGNVSSAGYGHGHGHGPVSQHSPGYDMHPRAGAVYPCLPHVSVSQHNNQYMYPAAGNKFRESFKEFMPLIGGRQVFF